MYFRRLFNSHIPANSSLFVIPSMTKPKSTNITAHLEEIVDAYFDYPATL